MTDKEIEVQIALGTMKKYRVKHLIEITIDEFYAVDDDTAHEEVSRKMGLFLNMSPDHPGVVEGADWDYASTGSDDVSDFVYNNGSAGLYKIDEDGEWDTCYD